MFDIIGEAPTPTPVRDLAVRAVIVGADIVAVLALSVIMFMPGGCFALSRHDDVRTLSPYRQLCEFGGFLEQAHPATSLARYTDGTTRYHCEKHVPPSSVSADPLFHRLYTSRWGGYIFLFIWYAYATGKILTWLCDRHLRGWTILTPEKDYAVEMLDVLPALAIAGFWLACWWLSK